MARKPREKSNTGIYAIILRGNGAIFAQAEMRESFSAAAEKHLGKGLLGVRFYDDKAHMLVKESDAGISLDMKPLVTSFARTYNRTHKTEGKVFADRFKSVPVESDAVKKECVDHLNGGETAAPYISGARQRTAPAKLENPVQKADDKKPAQTANTEPANPAKPKKKKNTLPSWLL